MRQTAESLTQRLGKIYEQRGYRRFKMNKFEEYDTYVKNKDYLVSDKVITFTDTNGKLLAMKPDVTISIIKNFDDDMSGVQRMYYNENVYRVSGGHDFREIMQSGLECMGDVDTYCICEVLTLAAKSLGAVSAGYMLDVSHLGLVSALIDSCGARGVDAREILAAVGEKNLPALESVCTRIGMDDDAKARICALVTVYGPITEVVDKLDIFCTDEATKKAADELRDICAVLSDCGVAHRVHIDFSVVNNMKYYNGIVFCGYIDGTPSDVLSGGQYDGLMAKMGKKSRAIGFAIYMNMFERLLGSDEEYDADVLMISGGAEPLSVSQEVRAVNDTGRTVIVQKSDTGKFRCREKIILGKRGTDR